MAWQQNSDGWWGEGEFKAFIDGDVDYPTICGTGTEDYFGGAWCFGANYSAPFLGYADLSTIAQPGREMVARAIGTACTDFTSSIPSGSTATCASPCRRSDGAARVATCRSGRHRVGRLLVPSEPHAAFPALGNRDDLEVI